MYLESPVFKNNNTIPEEYTKHGRDLSPPLDWKDVPDEAIELVMICEDLDSVDPIHKPYTHWIVYNMHSYRRKLPAGASKSPGDKVEYEQGENSENEIGYVGPDPTPGTGLHRYRFKLYAVDIQLHLPPGAGRSEVLNAMEGHVIAESEYTGLHRFH